MTTATATATIQAPVTQKVETRQYLAIARYQIFDFQLDDIVWRPTEIGPFPVRVGPGEPYRAEAAALLLLPDGYVLESWYPEAPSMDFVEF